MVRLTIFGGVEKNMTSWMNIRPLGRRVTIRMGQNIQKTHKTPNLKTINSRQEGANHTKFEANKLYIHVHNSFTNYHLTPTVLI